MNKKKIINTFEKRLFPMCVATYDKDLIVRYNDAIDVLRQLLEELEYKEFLNDSRSYDYWGDEIN